MIFSPKARTDAIFYDKIIHFDLTYIVLAAEGGRKGYWHPVYARHLKIVILAILALEMNIG